MIHTFSVYKTYLVTRCYRVFSTTRIISKELPRPSLKYMSDVGEQPVPLSEKDIAAQEVSDIDLPQATLDEKAEIKKAMKKRSLRMTFWQLFLVTLLGSSTLNIMRERNLKEELEENFDKKLTVLENLVKDAKAGKITVEDVRASIGTWNERFVDVFGLRPIVIEGPEGLDKEKLRTAYQKVKGIELDTEEHKTLKDSSENPKEKLAKFL